MKPDKYRKRFQAPNATERVRRQIAVEAARRLFETVGPEPDDPLQRLKDATEADFYTAKRKAAAVLGHRVRPGDLPSDSEVRDELVTLSRARSGPTVAEALDQPEPVAPLATIAEHLDRFAVYRLRLSPLEAVKQNPKAHPEGDALYHSLQVFERARDVRPYDEEFLLAALLHDVGKAIDASDHVAAGVEALRGAVTDRTLWLIAHHMDLPAARDRDKPRARKSVEPETPEQRDDLRLLRDCDDAGRVPGQIVGTLDEALDYLKGLENESYLNDDE
ncbi:MAG: HD domain-containing protein [Isosphaeraceae bacterium]